MCERVSSVGVSPSILCQNSCDQLHLLAKCRLKRTNLYSIQNGLIQKEDVGTYKTAHLLPDMMDSLKEAVKTSNSDLVIVPGGCTKYIQAPDVCWNKPFKEFIGTKYDHWMAEGVHQYTEAGNMKPPPRKKIVQWIFESWAALSKEVIVESFK